MNKFEQPDHNVPEINTFGPKHRGNFETSFAHPSRACGFDSSILTNKTLKYILWKKRETMCSRPCATTVCENHKGTPTMATLLGMGCYATCMPMMSSGCWGPICCMATRVLLGDSVTVVELVTNLGFVWHFSMCL